MGRPWYRFVGDVSIFFGLSTGDQYEEGMGRGEGGDERGRSEDMVWRGIVTGQERKEGRRTYSSPSSIR